MAMMRSRCCLYSPRKARARSPFCSGVTDDLKRKHAMRVTGLAEVAIFVFIRGVNDHKRSEWLVMQRCDFARVANSESNDGYTLGSRQGRSVMFRQHQVRSNRSVVEENTVSCPVKIKLQQPCHSPGPVKELRCSATIWEGGPHLGSLCMLSCTCASIPCGIQGARFPIREERHHYSISKWQFARKELHHSITSEKTVDANFYPSLHCL